MQSFSMVEFVRNIRDVTLAAARAPVALTQHRKPRYVLMSTADFERLSDRANDPRKVYLTEDMPAESVALFLAGLQPAETGVDRAD